ncbi:transcriptional regulator, partial [Salmonella enterica subsp. enterica serovar Reading]|nr:transcriptional regulator [Salmonella enterica subsp. enterica serovar Reading]
IRSASSKEERQDLSNLRAVKMLMNGFNSDLDVAFKNLNLV